MTKSLEGKRIVLAASRKTEEMSSLVEKQGGLAIVRPLQGTAFVAEQEVQPDLRRLAEAGTDWMIFTTGIGTETLVRIAEEIGLGDAFLNQLKRAKIAVRGYKTRAAVKKLGLDVAAADDDGTTHGLIRALKPYSLEGQRVAVQLHGDTAPRLMAFLEHKGAIPSEILPYRHIAPDPQVVETACQEIMTGEVDAVCFTSAPQVRFLFDYAREKGVVPEIRDAFAGPVVAVAVGKITAEMLKDEGVTRVVAPEHERMGAMIMALAQYYGRLSHDRSR